MGACSAKYSFDAIMSSEYMDVYVCYHIVGPLVQGQGRAGEGMAVHMPPVPYAQNAPVVHQVAHVEQC